MAEVKVDTKVAEKKETFDDIKSKTVLEDSDLDLIAAQAQKELADEKKAKEPKKEPEEEVVAPKKETDELSEEEKKATEAKEAKEATEKAVKEAEEKSKEEVRILEAKDEDLKPEEKTRKAELLVLKADAEKKAVDEDVKAISKEYSITEDEAQQSLEHVQKIREKYKDDPKGLAKANYFLQKTYSQQSAELKTLKSAPQTPPPELNIENVIKLVDKGQIRNKDGKPISREMVIEGYRKEYTDITETMDDETVLKMAAKDYIKGYEGQQREFHIQMTAKAKEKRAEIKKSISEADKEYLPDIEPIIDNLPDRAILQEGFSLEDTIRWAKGKKFDTLKTDLDKQVKEAEDRGYKRGKEEAKILGEKKKPEEGKPIPKSKTRTLSEAEKNRALNMFDGQAIPDEEKFKLFLEIESEHKKKKE